MRATLLILALSFALALSGCSGTGGMMPISDEMLATGVEGASTQVGIVADASAIKEMAVMQTLRNRDQMIKEAYADSGVNLHFMMMEVSPGVFIQVLDSFTSREQAHFDQKLPTAPSIHPGWRALENIGTAAIKGTVAGFAINAARDVLKDTGNTTTTTNSSTVADNSTVSSLTDSHAIGPVDR